jgi:hypothetical protein
MIRRQWTPEAADEWTREDWIAIVLSPVVFALVMIGVTKLILGQLTGVWLTVAAVAGALLLYWVIDPKLRAVSSDYEAKQAGYLAELERQLRWENQASGGSAGAGGT